jgi:hypothetical protein
VNGRSETAVEKQIPGLYFQGQGMYGRPRNPGSRSSAPSRPSNENTKSNAFGQNGIDRFGKPRLCNNCQSKHHFIRDCDKPRNILRKVPQLIKDNPKQIRQILFEMCLQAEGACFADTEEEFSAFFSEAEQREEAGPEETASHTSYFQSTDSAGKRNISSSKGLYDVVERSDI